MHQYEKNLNFAIGIRHVIPLFHLFIHQNLYTMRKLNLLWLFLSLTLLTVPVVSTFASDEEIEIELLEVSGFIPGDNPLDDEQQDGSTPPRPTDFRATITGRTLAVTVDNPNSTQVIVRNAAGAVVLNRSFYNFTSEQLPQIGAYSLELQNAGMTLVGQFNAQ